MSPRCFFCVGTSLATLTNVEFLLGKAPSVLPGERIPLLPPLRRVMSDNSVQRNGKVNVPMKWDVLTHGALEAAIAAWWGGYTVSSAELYAVWLDESRYYSPFKVSLERPLPGEHYQDVNPRFLQDLIVPGTDWRLQSALKTANTTVTAADRLLYVDTSAGSRTMTLPPAATPAPYTPFSFIKAHVSNSLIIDGDGAETVDGAATLTLTALNARAVLYSDGARWRSVPR